MKLNKPLLVAIVLGVTGTILTAKGLQPGSVSRLWDRHYTDNAYVRGDITQVAPRVAGHVTEVEVSDNERVTRGQVLFRIDDRDYQAKLSQAEAVVSSRLAAIGNLNAQLQLQRSGIRQAEAALQQARAEAQRSTRDALRARQLAEAQLIALSQLDQVNAGAQVSDGRVAEALALLASAGQRLVVLESQRPQLLADAEAAKAVADLARIDLESTVIRAPVTGRVSERAVRQGQYVRAGTQMIALVQENPWVVANFKETQLTGLKVGDPVEVRVDAEPEHIFHGRLQSLSPASGSQFALLAPDNATGNFTRIAQRVPVRIELEPTPDIKHLLPGMSATVRVRKSDT